MQQCARDALNALYRPLHEAAKGALKTVRALGYEVCLTYCNLHEVMVDGAYQTEYFPLPELALERGCFYADLGITLDASAWLELTVSKERSLKLDYALLAQSFNLEIYGVEGYLTGFYRAGMDVSLTREAIERSSEREIHLLFSLESASGQAITSLFERLAVFALVPAPSPI